MADSENKIEVKFFFLCLIGRSHNDYKLISLKVRDEIDKIPFISKFEHKGDKNDPESWYSWNDMISIKFNNSTENCNIKIKHFKVRIIIEITRVYENTDFVDLFKKAREGREFIKDNKLIQTILGISITDHVEKIYSYPFIQIDKEYESSDFSKIGDETITSFFYEVHDARRENLRSLFFWRPKKTLIRVSRPSIISTEMSDFMRSEIINIVYDACLQPLRKNEINEPSDKEFNEMKNYIGTVLFEHEEIISGAELARSVNTLSIIMSIGAIAGILAIISILLDPKTWVGCVLLVVTIIILVLVLQSKKNN